jgi:YegS/Rv2252/BmrU family lipid kinase
VRACLIINPQSGQGGRDLLDAVAVLQAHGWETTVQRKEHSGQATALARDAAAAGYDVVVGCGGDGTLRQIVDGLVGTNVAIGCLPCGTVNLWARELGISRRPAVAARQLIGAERRRIDVGEVRINGHHKRHFFLMAGLGIDGAIMARTSSVLKQRIGPLAVGLAGLAAAPSLRPAPIQADLDGVHWRGTIVQMVVSNTRLYGGIGAITPGAYVDDGLLDVCLFTADGPLAMGRQIASLLLRHRADDASAEWYRTASLTMQAPWLLPLQLDGGAKSFKKIDPDRPAVFSFSVIAQGAIMLVPRAYSGALFRHDPLLAPLAGQPADAALPDTIHAVHAALDGAEAGHEKGALRVTAVGVSSFTAVRLKNGRVWTVTADARTLLEGPHGDGAVPLLQALPTLPVGAVLRVTGDRDRGRHTIAAEMVRLLDAGEIAAAVQ